MNNPNDTQIIVAGIGGFTSIIVAFLGQPKVPKMESPASPGTPLSRRARHTAFFSLLGVGLAITAVILSLLGGRMSARAAESGGDKRPVPVRFGERQARELGKAYRAESDGFVTGWVLVNGQDQFDVYGDLLDKNGNEHLMLHTGRSGHDRDCSFEFAVRRNEIWKVSVEPHGGSINSERLLWIPVLGN